MSTNDTSSSGYQPGKLPRPRRRNENLHLEILRRVAIGIRNKDIAQELGCSIRLVSKVKNDPTRQLRLLKFVEDRDKSMVSFDERIRRRMEEAAEKSLARLEQCVRPVEEGGISDDRLVLQIAREALDRIGFPASNLSRRQQNFSPDTSDAIAEIFRNSRR